MNTLDLIILVMLAGGLVIGWRSGLIKQVVSFVGVIIAFLLALNLMSSVGTLVEESLGVSPDLSPLLGFVLVFLAVEVLVFALVRVLESVVGALKLGAVNRLLGGGVGALKAALILSVAFLVLSRLRVPSEDTRDASQFYAPVSATLPVAWDYATALMPQVEGLTERFQEGLEEHLPASEQVKEGAAGRKDTDGG